MWFLIRKSLHKNPLFFGQLFAISTFIHLFFLIIFLCIASKKQIYTYRIDMNRHPKQLKVVFNAPNVIIPVQRKQLAHKNVKAQSNTSAKTTKNEVKAAVKQLPVVTKTAPQLPASNKAKRTVKENGKALETTVKQNKKQEYPIQSVKTEHSVKTKEVTQVSTNENKEEQESIKIRPEERAQLCLQEQVYAAIHKQWKAPSGIAKGIMCEITFSIDQKGQSQSVAITQSSGILLYDIAARNAVSSSAFPQNAQLKEFHIIFRS